MIYINKKNGNDGYYKEYTNCNNSLIMEWKNNNGKLHRENGSAFIVYHSNGLLSLELFYINGVLHREGGPAKTICRRNGSVELEVFYFNGLRHRLNGPTQIYHDNKGGITETFHINEAYLGDGKVGFWALWEHLNDEERRDENILKLLLRYL